MNTPRADKSISFDLADFTPLDAQEIAKAAGIDPARSITSDEFAAIFLDWNHVEQDWVCVHASNNREIHIIADRDLGYAIHVNNCGEMVEPTQYAPTITQAIVCAIGINNRIQSDEQSQGDSAAPGSFI